MTNGTLGRVQAIFTQMAKPASNGESGKKWQRVGKNLNEALRGEDDKNSESDKNGESR